MTESFADIVPQIAEVSGLVGGELMVIGAHARDVVLDELGAPGGKRTEDVDVVIVLPPGAAYRDVVAPLGRPVNSLGFRFLVGDLPVDVIPAIEDVGMAAAFQPAKDVRLDVRGQFEAYQTARRREVTPGLWVRVPTAEALVVLKVISWGIRRRTTAKDAQDLHLILTAMGDHRTADERLWARGDLLERFDHDADAVSWFLIGGDARASLPGAGVAAAEILGAMGADLVRDMGRSDPGGVDSLRLGALHEGLSGA